MVTLTDSDVIRHLGDRYVVAWSNLLPELYGNSDPTAPLPPSYDRRAVQTTPEGSGGSNIRAYFCTSAGKIVHLSIGFWRPERFLAEAQFAERLLAGDRGQIAPAQRARRQEAEATFDEAKTAFVPSDPATRVRVAQAALRLRSATELTPDLLADVEAVLDRRREEVYTKGAVG
ncbi:MAG: hypothetical protein L0Z62_30005 [Gemmataceae bacterium]|nr:hypothetical protein [Gemmataceae bacterium]